MSLLSGVLEWTQLNLVPLGPFGLFSLAFVESSFFPVPPDVLLIPLVLAAPDLWLFFALVTTAGSVLGSLLGYAIGIKGGRPVLNRLAGRSSVEKAESYFRRYGDWAIAIAGFTPIPYKIFTILAGMMRHSVPKLLAISAVSRGARFLLVAGVTAAFGEAILSSLDMFFAASLAAVAIVIATWYLRRRFQKKP